MAIERANTSDLVESVAFVAAPVSNFVTLANKLVCVDESNTASQAVAVMTSNNIRHAVVLERCGPGFGYYPTAKVRGVVSIRTYCG